MSFDSLLKLIPAYIETLLNLVGEPRQFFALHSPNEDGALVRSLSFLVSSTVLAFVLRVPFLGDASTYFQTAIETVVLYIPTSVILGSLAYCCCRLVRGKASLPSHVTIFSYLSGVSTLSFALVSLVSNGIIKLRSSDEFDLYQEYMREHFPDVEILTREDRFRLLAENPALDFAIYTLLGGIVLIAIWMISAWRAYWDLNEFKRSRGIVALLVFLVSGYFVSWILSVAQFQRNVTFF